MTEEDIQLVQLLAHAYLQHARPGKAVALLAALDALAPGRPDLLRALALAQLRSGQAPSALETLQRMAAGESDAPFHLLRARALLACKRPIEGRAAMAACLAAMKVATQPSAVAG
jgi:predicted Zn-dependent protease